MNARDDGIDLARRGLIVEQCDRFRHDWRAGHGPTVEEFLAQVPEPDLPSLLAGLLPIEVEERRIRGECPTPSEYHERFPDHSTIVVATFTDNAAPLGAEHMKERPSQRSDPDTARNLLLGILALQNNFIDRAALLSAFNIWVEDKTRSLSRILVEQGRLDDARHSLLNALVAEHLKLHGDDPDRSLADLNSLGPVRRDLECIADPNVAVSLGHVGSCRAINDDPDATVNWTGTPGSDGTRFTVVRLHARGGLGEVFAATDEELHREVALKRIQDHLADDPDSRARFVQEAEITGGLEHPGIVPVYGLGLYANGRPFYAMRLVKGEDFRTAIARFHDADRDARRDPGERTLSLRRLLARFLDVCNAVAYAHSRGVLHRDLKPSNILLGKYGETLIIDWGLAKVVGRDDPASAGAEPTLRPPSGSGVESTRAGAAIGTPGYMSPEQARGEVDGLGPASDVFGLGATLYHLLTGRQPFPGDDFAERLRKNERCEFVAPRAVKPGVPRPLEAICLKAMAPQPGDRYHSPRALAEDIEHWMADEPVSSLHEPWSIRTMRWARRHRTPVATAAVSLLVATTMLVGVWGWLRHRQRGAEDLARSWLFEADRLAIEAANHSDLTRWGQAVAAARQAQGILDTGGGDPDLRRRIDATLAALRTQERDRQMLKDLYEVTLSKAAPTVRGRADFRAFIEANRRTFHWYGIDVESLPPARAISMIRASAIQKELVAALDAWAIVLKAGDPARARLFGITGALDDHPIRNAIRDANLRGAPVRDLDQLIGQAIGQRDISEYPPVWLYEMGNYLIQRGAPDAAIALFEPARRIYPDNIYLNYYLGLAHASCRPPRYTEAIRFHSIAVALRPDIAIGHVELARVLRSDAEPAAAMNELERSLELAPGYVPAYLELAATHRQLGHPNEAFESLMRARVICEGVAREQPDNLSGVAESETEIGNELSELGRYTEAARTFEKALAIHERRTRTHPDDALLWNDLLRACLAMGDRLRAAGRKTEAHRLARGVREFFEELAREHPGSARVASETGIVLHHLAGLDTPDDRPATLETIRQAIAHQKRAVALDPKDATYLGHLRNHLVHLIHHALDYGRPAEAAVAAREWAALVADKPDDLFEAAGAMSRCVRLAGDKARRDRYANQAIAMYRSVIAAAASNKDQVLYGAYHAMANLLRETGRSAEALRSLRDGLEIAGWLERERPGSARVASDIGVMLHHLAGLDTPDDRPATLETIRQAIAHQKRAIALDQKDATYPGHLRNHLVYLAQCAWDSRRPAEAASAAREWAALVADKPVDLYAAAGLMSVCVPAARDAAERDRWAADTLETLRAAVTAGWSDAAFMSRDPHFASLQGRPEFRRIVAELFDRGFPIDPFVP